MSDALLPHLDDESLSGLVDGALDAAAAEAARAHVAACATCDRRLEQVVAVRDAIGRDVETEPGGVDAAVTAALAAWDEPEALRRWRWARPPAAWIGAAAVVLALLAAVPLLLAQRSQDQLAARGEASSEKAEDEAGEPNAAGGAGTSAPATADFGSHDDTATLVALLDTGAYAAPPAAAYDASADNESSGGAQERRAQPQCVEAGRRVAAGRAGALLTTGPVSWRGEAAVVLLFAVEDSKAGGTRQLYVMSQVGCDLLAEQRF